MYAPQRKDAYMAAQTQARSTTTLANLSQAQQRHQQLKDAQALQQQERLQVWRCNARADMLCMCLLSFRTQAQK